MAAVHMIGPPSLDPAPTQADAAASWWTAWGCVAQVAVTDRDALKAARRLVQRELADTERAAFRFRPDAEIHKLYRAGGRTITVSPLLAELIAAALATAERTGGDVDPTVAAAVTRLDLASLTRHRSPVVPSCGQPPVRRLWPAAGWESVSLEGRRLQVPAGVTLDLTATAKTRSCDRAAFRVADRLGVGVTVALGGNVATAGTAPEGGWTVRVQDGSRDRHGTVQLLAGAALATSDLSRMVDPRTGLLVGDCGSAVWRSASAIGFSCLEATSYTAAALVRGPGARAWLSGQGVPARLITLDDHVVAVAGWRHHEDQKPAGVPAPRITNPQRTTLR